MMEYDDRLVGARRDRERARKALSNGGDMKIGNLVVAAFLAMVVLGGMVAAIGGAVLMLGLDLAHRDLPVVPALGFGSSFGIVIALQAIGHALRGATAEVKA